jgi:hypothetical protein
MLLPSQKKRLWYTLLLLTSILYISTSYSPYRLRLRTRTGLGAEAGMGPGTGRLTAHARRAEIQRILTMPAEEIVNSSDTAANGDTATLPITSTSSASSSAGSSAERVTWTDPALNKAFGLPEFESKVFPFFYRHAGSFEEDELTMTVFVTENRLDRLRDLVVGYEGQLLP